MMAQVTEEQSINSALMLCTSGIQSGVRFGGWITRHAIPLIKGGLGKDKIEKLISDACSAYRGGFVEKSNTAEMKELIDGLRGTEVARANGNFFFLGDKTDLSYFWKKVDKKSNSILLKQYIDSIPNDMLRKNVTSIMTQAKAEGLLSYDGKAYALTDKGKAAIYDPKFVARRLEAEEGFLQNTADVLKAEAEKINGGELLSDACSKYRGGFVSKDSPELTPMIDNLKGVDVQAANGNFYFTGGRGDLSYFWQKTGDNTYIDMPKSMIDGIQNESLKANVTSTMTQARLEGLVTDEGDFYRLTEQGNKAIHNPKFVAERLKKEAITEAKGLDGVGEKYHVFTNGTEAHEFNVIKADIVNKGDVWLTLSSKEQGDIFIPKESINIIAFENKEEGLAYVQANSEKVAEYQEIIKIQENIKAEASEQLIGAEEYTKDIEETDASYLVSVGENDYEKLEIPKADVEKLEDGSIRATMYNDKEYTVKSGEGSYKVNGAGAKDLLDKGGSAAKTAETTGKTVAKSAENAAKTAEKTGKAAAKTAEATVKTAAKTAETVGNVASAAVDTAANTIDGVATAYPPAKAVTATLNVIYKIADMSAKTAYKAVEGVTKTATQANNAATQKL